MKPLGLPCIVPLSSSCNAPSLCKHSLYPTFDRRHSLHLTSNRIADFSEIDKISGIRTLLDICITNNPIARKAGRKPDPDPKHVTLTLRNTHQQLPNPKPNLDLSHSLTRTKCM